MAQLTRVIDVDQRALENARARYVHAHTRFEGGIGSQLDDTRALRSGGQRESRPPWSSHLAGLEQAQEALGVLVGSDGPLDAEDSRCRTCRATKSPGTRSRPLAGATCSLERARVRGTRRVVKDTWADYAPTLSGPVHALLQQSEHAHAAARGCAGSGPAQRSVVPGWIAGSA